MLIRTQEEYIRRVELIASEHAIVLPLEAPASSIRLGSNTVAWLVQL